MRHKLTVDIPETLEWLKGYDEEERDRVVDFYNDKLSCLDCKVGGYNNSLNSFSDVFDLMLAFAKIELAPGLNCSKEELCYWNSLMDDRRDIILLVYHYMKEHYQYPTYGKQDDEHIKFLIKGY